MRRSLTAAVLDYQRRGEGFQSAMEELCLIVYHYPRRIRGWTEDDCSEFFLSFFPRLLRLVSRFQDSGRPFEVYLHTCLRWHLRTYIYERQHRRRRECLLRSREIWEGCVAESYGQIDDDADSETPPSPTCSPRRILLLLFKCVLEVSDHHIEHVASRIGVNRDRLFHIVQNLRAGLDQRRNRLSQLAEKRNACYFRILSLREELRAVCDGEREQGLRKRLREEERRFRLALDEIARVPRSPTHSDISRFMGIPKGSVDSSLHYLRTSAAMRRAAGE